MPLPFAPRLPLPKPPTGIINNLPRLLFNPVRHSPFILQRLLLENVLRHVFAEAIKDGEFEFLHNRFLKVEISDIGLAWFFSFNGRQLTIQRYGRADARICGELREFLLLMGRQEDPDTLFFQRRLQIDGDTELGLEIKNMLDTIDLDNLPAPLRKGLQRLTALLA